VRHEYAAFLDPGHRRRLVGSYGAHPAFSRGDVAMNAFVVCDFVKRRAELVGGIEKADKTIRRRILI
jgi:hypothetical protein